MSPSRKAKNSTKDLHEQASELIDAGAALERILIELYPRVEGEVGLYDVIMDKEVRVFQEKNNEVLGSLGYTEHGIRHQSITAYRAGWILRELGYPLRTQELSAVAGYIHDIGGVVNRTFHEFFGAIIGGSILKRMGMVTEERIECMMAIGNHDEKTGSPVSPISAAVIIADKSDVHRSRVRNPSMISFDIHDRVNYAAKDTGLTIDTAAGQIKLAITIDTQISTPMEYFEIFLTRMIICRKAARKLGLDLKFEINGMMMS
jgi:hypothetical protein